jgi:hypothetical protein
MNTLADCLTKIKINLVYNGVNFKLILLVLLLSIVSISCADNENIELEKLSKVYVDLLIVEDFYKDNDSLDLKREEVFKEFSITEAMYDSAFKKFEHDSEKWELFFRLSNAYLDSLKSDITVSKKPKPQRLR